MCSSLEPILAGICMTELEQTLLPQMVDTIAAIHPDRIEEAFKTQNNKRIQFTHELKKKIVHYHS